MLEDTLDLSNYWNSKKDILNKKRKAIDDENKQKAFNIRDIAIKNLKEIRQIAEKEDPGDKGSTQISTPTFEFLRPKLQFWL